MIANTTAAIEKITGQLKTLNTFRKFMTLLLYSAYLIYRIVAGNGYFALNVTLLALTCLYAAFFVYYISVDRNATNKKTYGVVKRVYRWSKLLLTGIGVGLNVSGFLTVAGEGLTLPNLLFAIVMPAFLVLQIVFDVIFEYANYCFGILKKGVEKDIEKVKETYQKPLNRRRRLPWRPRKNRSLSTSKRTTLFRRRKKRPKRKIRFFSKDKGFFFGKTPKKNLFVKKSFIFVCIF